MPRNPLSDRRNIAINVVLWLFIPVVLIIPFLIIFPSAFRDAQKQNRVANAYLPVDAAVISSQVKTSTGSKGRIYYDPDIQYQYEVNGTKYHSGNISAFWIDGGEEWAEAVVAQYKAGQTCKAYYDPDDPSQVVLLRKQYFQPYKEMLMFAFIMTGGLFMILQVWFSKKYDPAPAGDGWFEVRPELGERQRLVVAKACTAMWYGFGAIPATYFFLSIPPPYSTTALRDFGIFALLGLVPVGFWIRYLLMCRHLDEAQVKIDRAALHLGQSFNFAISQCARRASQAKHFTVQVLCIGTKVHGKTRDYTTLYETTPAELKNHTLRAGENLELSGRLVLPANQRPSGRDATGKYTWINWKIQLDCKLAGGPDYNVNFPVDVQAPVVEEPALPEKPGQLAQIQPVPPEFAGRIGAKDKIGLLIKLLPIFVQLLGIGMMASTFALVFPGKLGMPQFLNLPMPQAELIFWTGAVLAAVSSVVGIMFPTLLGGSYSYAVAKKEIGRRRDAIVQPDTDSFFVGIIPRSNWNRMNIKTADVGFMAIDAERREIRFEGDKERYHIPAAAILSCTMEKSVFAATAPPTAPGIWLVVLKIYTASGTREVSFAPYQYTSRMSTKLRLQAAQKLHMRIEAMLPKERQQPAATT